MLNQASLSIAEDRADRRLLASIHDVGPRFESEVDHLADRLSRHLGGPRFAMLVVPDHWGQAPLVGARAFQAKLRDWAASGVEMFVHGWTHRDDNPAKGFKAKHMTAGEGEFSALPEVEALRRMIEGRALIEDIIGRPFTGSSPPPGSTATARRPRWGLRASRWRRITCASGAPPTAPCWRAGRW